MFIGHAGKERRSKYGNVKTNGFDSKKEYHRAIALNAMADNGDILHLRKQVLFILQEPFRDAEGNAVRAITYVADFAYEKDGVQYVEDVKSAFTQKDPVYRIKKKMFLKRYPEIRFREIV